MTFTNPALYFRTILSTVTITPDPSNLDSTQILEFTSSGNTIIELVQNTYQNNVSIDPAINPDGIKKVVVQDNGRLEDIVVVTGKIDNTNTTFLTKLKTFSRKLQIEPLHHKFGIFGFAYPTNTSFALDPTATVGYFIDTIQITHSGGDKSNIPFILTLKSGGTLS